MGTYHWCEPNGEMFSKFVKIDQQPLGQSTSEFLNRIENCKVFLYPDGNNIRWKTNNAVINPDDFSVSYNSYIRAGIVPLTPTQLTYELNKEFKPKKDIKTRYSRRIKNYRLLLTT